MINGLIQLQQERERAKEIEQRARKIELRPSCELQQLTREEEQVCIIVKGNIKNILNSGVQAITRERTTTNE